ncbi:hypothetical protein Moror_5428, partial [Moniliophthora roreri MCA 2997]
MERYQFSNDDGSYDYKRENIHAFQAMHIKTASEHKSLLRSWFACLGHTNLGTGFSGCYDESGSRLWGEQMTTRLVLVESKSECNGVTESNAFLEYHTFML